MDQKGPDKKRGLTYAQAGVDIDAGNRMVEMIKPLVRATRRPGADAEIGGFGGLFDLKRTGFNDPVLVAATDGVGTKVKIAIETGRHDTIGIDLVAMSVNDLVVQGAEPLFFLDYFACSTLDPDVGAAVVAGIAQGCRESGCALIGGETAEMPGLYQPGDYDLAGFAVGAAERDAILPRDVAAGDIVLGLASSGVHSNGFSLVRKVADRAGLTWSVEGAVRFRKDLGRSRADADAALCEIVPRRDPRNQGREGAGAYHRRRISRQHPARISGRHRRAHRSRRRSGAAGVQMAGESRRCRARRNAAHLQLRDRHDRRGRPEGCRRGQRGPAPRRRQGREARRTLRRQAGRAARALRGTLDLAD